MTLTMMGAGFTPSALAGISRKPAVLSAKEMDDYVKDYLLKIRNFNRPHPSDRYLDPEKFMTLKSSVKRLLRLQKTIGWGHFHLLSFDDALNFSRNYSRIGRFSKEELDLMERIFYDDASKYGFFGNKPLDKLTDRIPKRKVIRVRNTGHYLYKGEPVKLYKKIRKDLGGKAVITSGIRSVMKQFLLFLKRTYDSKGNLSMASRSLAPPGYSFHGIGDFDVGQVGFGYDNFTERFASTEVFKKLMQLGYIDLRYVRDNMLGVRFEPWHIKVDIKT